MGNDGGSIPTRRELVKNASRAPTVSELKATALESLSYAWTHCALSGDSLDLESVVSDWRGRLYSYEAILKGLMPSDEAADVTPSSLGITSLRDVAKLKFSKSGDKWACPISMKEMSPSTKAVYLVPCGHVFADVAVSEIQERACPECSQAFEGENVITILPTTEEDKQRLERRMDGLRARGLTHVLRKDKSERRKKKRKGDEVVEDGDDGKGGVDTRDESKPAKETDSRISGINNVMAASLTAKVLAEQDERNKRRKLAAEGAARKGQVSRG